MSKPRFPLRRFYGESMQTFMHALILQRPRMDEILDAAEFTGRRVMGYKLPQWQRPEKWTTEQCINFIESIWLGANIGAFMVNQSMQEEFHDILLDGQQRLRAIERYLNDEFPVAGEDGKPHYWSEMTEGERAHFHRIPFPWILTRYNDEALLREAYNRHNFGGTPHEADERAPEGDYHHEQGTLP